MTNLAYLGMACALCLSALGSGIGSGIASQAAVGGWKKCFAEGRPASFIMVAFAGAPLTQTIYGFLLMNFIRSAFQETGNWLMALCVGIFGGAAIGFSAFMQGKVAVASCDALATTGKGELLHRHRYRRDGRSVLPGLLHAASQLVFKAGRALPAHNPITRPVSNCGMQAL